MDTGEVIGNVQGSEGFAYGCAVVDPFANGGAVAWVFGSPADLCSKNRTHRYNGVMSWWSRDLKTWSSTGVPAVNTSWGFPFNTGVSIVGSGTADLTTREHVPSHNFIMAMEHGRMAIHSSEHRNLSYGWNILPHIGSFGACPSVHWATSGYYYFVSGGTNIALTRTKDLSTWDHPTVGPLVHPNLVGDSKVSPYLGISTQYQTQGGVLKSNLEHPGCWDHYSNDADFCCQEGLPHNVSYIFYSASSQGHPPDKNCSHIQLANTNFNNIAVANVSLSTLLSTYFE
eukprot:m.4938 g.4938  ORF g.4938 m.4938 type:complete len:285 (+) comp3143_c0_seq1:456-1310(+)